MGHPVHRHKPLVQVPVVEAREIQVGSKAYTSFFPFSVAGWTLKAGLGRDGHRDCVHLL